MGNLRRADARFYIFTSAFQHYEKVDSFLRRGPSDPPPTRPECSYRALTFIVKALPVGHARLVPPGVIDFLETAVQHSSSRCQCASAGQATQRFGGEHRRQPSSLLRTLASLQTR